MSEPSQPDNTLARVIELETLYMHLQRTVGELDGVVLAQQKQIDELQRKIGLLSAELAATTSLPAEVRKPEDEKPPHY